MFLFYIIVSQMFHIHVIPTLQAYMKIMQLVILYSLRHFLHKKDMSDYVQQSYKSYYNCVPFVILRHAHKAWATQRSKTLDHLPTNYLFVGWRPKISCSLQQSGYISQCFVAENLSTVVNRADLEQCAGDIVSYVLSIGVVLSVYMISFSF